MLPVRSPVLPESRLTPAPFHKCVPTHPEHIGIGQHSTELAVYLHYFCKLWIRLLEERTRTQDCLFRLDAAAIGCQVERFAREPVTGTAVRPVLPSLQGNPRRRVDQIKVEPSVLFWIEPGFSGSQHQRGVGGRNELKCPTGKRLGISLPKSRNALRIDRCQRGCRWLSTSSNSMITRWVTSSPSCSAASRCSLQAPGQPLSPVRRLTRDPNSNSISGAGPVFLSRRYSIMAASCSELAFCAS